MSARVKPDAFLYRGGSIGLLLIHGFTGSAAEMLPMGQYFKQRGMTVYAPLLAGHGTSPEDMIHTRWPDWKASAESGLKRLQTLGCADIFVAGLSMGGTLALDLACTHPITGVISMCAPIKLRDKRSWLAPLIQPFMPYLRRMETKAPHIEDAIVPYERTPLACVTSLLQLIRKVRRQLSNMDAPAFIAQAMNDETVEPESATMIFDSLSSSHKELHWYEHSGHIITLDHDREQLFQDIAQFIEQIVNGQDWQGRN